MNRDVIASTYARALADVAVERNVADRIRAELDALALADAAAAGDPAVAGLTAILQAPRVPVARKQQLVQRLASQLDLAEETGRFLAVLVEHNRIELLGAICRQFRKQTDRLQGFVLAEVASAYPLSDAQTDGIREALARAFGKTVDLRTRVQPELLAGVRVRVDGRVLDGTVDGMMRRLEATLGR